MQRIPIQKSANFSTNVILDKINYRFEFRFDSFYGFWYFSIYDYQNNAIIQNKRLVLNCRLMQKLSVRLWGFLYAVCDDQTKSNISYEDLTNGLVEIYWVSPEEV
jgi:hypothetical protein